MISAARLIANSFVNATGSPVARIHPRINLTRCEYCNATGRSVIRYMGRVREDQCAWCAGRGSIVTDESSS